MCTLIYVTVYQKCKRNGIVSLGLSSFLLALIVKSVAIADSLDVTSTFQMRYYLTLYLKEYQKYASQISTF